ncbi:hypothetical protein CU098_010536 [Rhizopus stolonifer]|uniref:Uncharacterized protein n=2 Tax=Mucorineae TaxID=1344963 RepID=A0A367JH63_RHIST|nr:hypothetical protein CU098_010536 [Rhizopus stolonifer]
MPAWDYQAILSNKIEKPKETPDLMRHLAGQFLLSVVQLANSMPCETNRNDINLPPLLPEDRDFASSDEKKTPVTLSSSLSSYLPASSSYSSYSSLSSCSYMEELYDTLIQSALINSSNSDRSFWWWDNQSQAL